MPARTISLRSVAWDTSLHSPDLQDLVCFEDVQEREVPSVTGTAEHDLVRGLLADARVRNVISSVLSLPHPMRYALRVSEPFASPTQKPGDVDLLIASTAQPQFAVALEAKQIKVRSRGDGRQRINKFIAVGRADGQLEGLLALGFSRTFLMLLAIVDDRQDTGSNFLFRDTTDATFQRVVDLAGESTIPEQAGILCVEVSQPIAKPILNAGMVSVGVLREAARREQPGDLSQRVASYLEAHGVPKP